MTDPYRVLVTGSRDWQKVEVVRFALDYAFCEAAHTGRPLTVVHGACPAGAEAQGPDAPNSPTTPALPVKTEPHPANWHINGKRAGFIRNAHMVNLGADVCLAFIKDGTRRASHTAALAEQPPTPPPSPSRQASRHGGGPHDRTRPPPAAPLRQPHRPSPAGLQLPR